MGLPRPARPPPLVVTPAALSTQPLSSCAVAFRELSRCRKRRRASSSDAEQVGLDDDDGRLLLVNEPAQLGAAGLEGGEVGRTGSLVVMTGDGLVFAQVDGENGARGRGRWHRVHGASSSWGCWGLFAW